MPTIGFADTTSHKAPVPGENNVTVTPARPSDLDALIALFDRSSAESRRQRFHATMRHMPRRYLHDIVSGAAGVVARVARDMERDPSGGCVVALATAVPENADRAELAVWVDDAWHRHGIGMRVTRAVVDQLAADGVRYAVAYLDPTNVAANALVQSLARELAAPQPNAPVVSFDLTHIHIGLAA
jgi:ribosomal protein S18 acetylase RimI-like enzyme